MHKQKGLSLSGLLVWGFILAMVSLLIMRVAPSVIEYYKIRKDIKAVVLNSKPDTTVADLRRAYERFADIDQISDVRPEDLDIAKEGNQIVISFAYEKKIRLFGPVSVLIDYQGSSAGQ